MARPHRTTIPLLALLLLAAFHVTLETSERQALHATTHQGTWANGTYLLHRFADARPGHHLTFGSPSLLRCADPASVGRDVELCSEALPPADANLEVIVLESDRTSQLLLGRDLPELARVPATAFWGTGLEVVRQPPSQRDLVDGSRHNVDVVFLSHHRPGGWYDLAARAPDPAFHVAAAIIPGWYHALQPALVAMEALLAALAIIPLLRPRPREARPDEAGAAPLVEALLLAQAYLRKLLRAYMAVGAALLGAAVLATAWASTWAAQGPAWRWGAAAAIAAGCLAGLLRLGREAWTVRLECRRLERIPPEL